ncbi:MAG: peptide chain release factor N(5)-glutamine methyltransferase [Gemmatimonadaceae bacterium]
MADSAAPGADGLTSRSVGSLLRDLSAELCTGVVEDPAGEARDILAAVLSVERLWPAANREAVVPDRLRTSAFVAARKRALGCPFAYCVGKAMFRHHTLHVDERVLIPRQETEVLVDHVLEWRKDAAGGLAIDIGTGSGGIAISLASEGGSAFDRVIGTDISLGALAVARSNAERLLLKSDTRVEFRHGALFAPVRDERASVLVANPPYIAWSEAADLPASVRDWEPPIALFGGRDGMVVTEALIRGAVHVLEPGGLLALELDSRRAARAAALALEDGRYRDINVLFDLTGRERFLMATRIG